MDPSRILVVFYSRTGTTRTVADAIRRELRCDIDRIFDLTPRDGVRGYLRAGFDAFFHRPARLQSMNTDPRDYDLVVVGTPVWNASVSAPVRTYLEENADRFKRVAFFLTHGGSSATRVLRQMEEACGHPAAVTLVLRADEVRRGACDARVRTFASALGGGDSTGARPPSPVTL